MEILISGLDEKINKELAMELVDKIKDEQLRNHIKAYIQYRHPLDLHKVLEYFNIKGEVTSFDKMIPIIKIFKAGILLGGEIWYRVVYTYVLRIYDNFIILETFGMYWDLPISEWVPKIIRIKKFVNVYRCDCGFMSANFKEFFEHFLEHKEIESRFDQIMNEMEILKEEEGKLA